VPRLFLLLGLLFAFVAIGGASASAQTNDYAVARLAANASARSIFECGAPPPSRPAPSRICLAHCA
jgi:hypothetical protein